MERPNALAATDKFASLPAELANVPIFLRTALFQLATNLFLLLVI